MTSLFDMSSVLVWEPTDREKTGLSNDLKYVLRKSYGEPISFVLSQGDIPYLTGLKDAGVKDANALIVAIKKYRKITVTEDWG
jgi:hypothetical protein